jgi:type I restriction enzyme R subunit
VAQLRAELAEKATEAERRLLEAQEAHQARLTAEERRQIAEAERQVYEELALEAERKATQPPVSPEAQKAFVTAAFAAARDLVLDEADTRLLIDEQLRQAGWEADTQALRYAKGTRPERGRNLAVAEWPTNSGPADYALFVGRTLVGVVEAKRKRRNVAASLDDQSTRYSQDIGPDESFDPAGGPWNGFHAPFIFATNGRSYYPQLATQSGIWFRDVRRPTNAARALEGWPTPEGLAERLEVDRDAAEAALRARPFTFGFALRPHQIEADPEDIMAAILGHLKAATEEVEALAAEMEGEAEDRAPAQVAAE